MCLGINHDEDELFLNCFCEVIDGQKSFKPYFQTDTLP